MKVKVESEKVGLKLNIQKTKIMASGPNTSWQIDRETMETGRLYFLGLQNHCRRWLQPWNEKTLAPWKKSYDQPRQNIKKQKRYFGDKSGVAQSCLTLCDPMDCSLPGSLVHGILQARILKWVAISFSRGSSQPGNRTWVSHIAGRCITIWDLLLELWLNIFYIRRRQWHPTPVLLPGKSHGWRSLVGCSPWGR